MFKAIFFPFIFFKEQITERISLLNQICINPLIKKKLADESNVEQSYVQARQIKIMLHRDFTLKT